MFIFPDYNRPARAHVSNHASDLSGYYVLKTSDGLQAVRAFEAGRNYLFQLLRSQEKRPKLMAAFTGIASLAEGTVLILSHLPIRKIQVQLRHRFGVDFGCLKTPKREF